MMRPAHQMLRGIQQGSVPDVWFRDVDIYRCLLCWMSACVVYQLYYWWLVRGLYLVYYLPSPVPPVCTFSNGDSSMARKMYTILCNLYRNQPGKAKVYVAIFSFFFLVLDFSHIRCYVLLDFASKFHKFMRQMRSVL